MKKHFIAAALILSVVIIFSGCYPTGEKSLPSDVSDSTSEKQSFVGTVSETINNAEFNYEISPDFPTQLPKIRLKPAEFDEELFKKVLLSGKTINPEANRPEWVYETTDESVLCIGGNWISFGDGRVDDNRSNQVTIASHYNCFCCSNGEELSSFSSEDAISRAKKLLDELGIENYGEPCVIAVSPEVGNSELKEYGVATTNKEQSSDDYDLWAEDDGIYIIKFRENINGIDISNGNLYAPDSYKSIQGADISVYVKKDMIFYLNISAWYDIVSLNEETVDLTFDAGYASNALLELYGKIPTLKSPMKFTECKPEYVPQGSENGELIFTPAWCFSGYQLRGPLNDIFVDCAEYYYAETGIRYGGV